MKKILTLLAIALAALTSCMEEVQYSISIDTSELSFSSAGGEGTVKVTSTADWELSGDSYWCYASEYYGQGDAEIIFTADANEDSESSRSATFTFISGDKKATLTVTQEKKEYSISIEPIELTFGAEGGEQEIVVTASDVWNISSMPDWIEASEQSGENEATVIVTAEYAENNVEADYRSGEIVFTCGDKEAKVSVSQKADDSPIIQFKDPRFLSGALSYCDKNEDGQISEKEASVCTKLGVANVRNLEEIKYFTALTELYFYDNELTSLDLSNNTALTKLEFGNTTDYIASLLSLDLSKNIALTYLDCRGCQFASLDLSNNTALTELYCSSNQLTSLDLSNNTALTKLYCSSNQLTSLDLSNNTALTELDCSRNQLSSLDLSNNTALIKLICYYTSIESLDLGNNRKLERFEPALEHLFPAGSYGGQSLVSLILYRYHILDDFSIQLLDVAFRNRDLEITYVE